MLKENVLPVDTLIIVNKTILNDHDRLILTMLYQPIIGYQATSLYFSLWACLDKKETLSDEFTHHQLMMNMQLKLSEIISSREKLEALGLLKTYVRKTTINNFIYELYSPLSAYEFLNNPLLAMTLYNHLGETEYDKIVQFYKIPKISLKDYEDITCSFNDIFKPVNISHFDVLENLNKYTSNKLQVQSDIDINTIVSLLPEELFNVRSLTNETKDLIHKIAFIYNYDNIKISEIIKESLTDKRTINKQAFKLNSRKYYQFEHSGKLPSIIYKNQPESLRKETTSVSKKAKLIYQFETTSPYDFLASKYKTGSPSKSDIRILEYLLLELNLNTGVVNVLIDYVLKINQNKLTKNFIDVIASQWAKSGIETVEQAMDLAEKEYKKRSKIKPKKTTVKPDWFNKDIKEVEAKEEDLAEIEKLLSKYG